MSITFDFLLSTFQKSFCKGTAIFRIRQEQEPNIDEKYDKIAKLYDVAPPMQSNFLVLC